MPPFMSMPQGSASAHLANAAVNSFSTTDFPVPVVPAISTCPRRAFTRTGEPSSYSPVSMGLVIVVVSGSFQGIGWACGSFSMTRNIMRSARAGSDAARAVPGRIPVLD